MTIIFKSESRKFLKHSSPYQACTGIKVYLYSFIYLRLPVYDKFLHCTCCSPCYIYFGEFMLKPLYKCLQILKSTGPFIIFSVITNIYNKKTNGPNLMELFTATEKLKQLFLTTRDIRFVHHG